MCLCLCRVGQASSSTGRLLSCTCTHTEVRTWCRKDTDTRITRRGGVGAVKTAFAFSTHHCLFTFPPHQSAITAPFPSLLIRGQAREAEQFTPSTLRRRRVSASKNHFDRCGVGEGFAAARVESDRRLPSSSFLEQCGSGAWQLALLHGSTPSKAKRFQGTDRTTKPQPKRNFPFPSLRSCS